MGKRRKRKGGRRSKGSKKRKEKAKEAKVVDRVLGLGCKNVEFKNFNGTICDIE